MRRAASLVTLLGTVVLVSWTLARLAPVAQGPASITASSSSPPSSVVSELDAEVAKLHGRADRVEPLTPTNRDPFRFGAPYVAPRSKATTPEPPPPPPPPPPAPTLPKLVAITSKDTPGGAVRTAAFSVGDDVLLARPGDKVGSLVVRSIADGLVELVDPVSGIAYRVR
jgi:hypothetical protein